MEKFFRKEINLLLIEDDEDFLSFLNNFFSTETSNINVTSTTFAEKALEILKNDNTFDVIVTDIKMKGLNGIEFLKTVRELNFNLPVIIITAYPEVETAMQAVKLSAYDYLQKPFKIEKLLSSIYKAVDKYRRMVLFYSNIIDSVLSAQEREVFSLFFRGSSKTEIADKLNVKAQTINTYFKRGETKLKKINFPG